MFKGLGNIAEMMKQFGRIRGEMEQITDELRHAEVEGLAGGGMVKVRANGKQEILGCTIEPSVVEGKDAEFIEDLVVAATNQALEKSRQLASERMAKLGDGLNIPGLSEAMSQFGGLGPK